MKKIAGYAVAAFLGSLVSIPVTMAGTTYVQALKGTSTVTLNGQTVASPPKLVYGGTTYVQLYSIELALKQAGITPAWNGTTFSMKTNVAAATGGIVFSNTLVKSDGLGGTEVDGIADNTDTVQHSFTFVVSFYDASGKLLGVANGTVNDLAAGQTIPFQAMATQDYTSAASYKVQVDTLL